MWPWFLGGVFFLLAASGVLDYGLTWDEPTYFRFARLQRDWVLGIGHALFAPSEFRELFSSSRIEQVWLQHAEKNGHPPLNETWQGLAGAVFRILGWHDLQSFRTSIALLFAFTAVALYSLLRRNVGSVAATAGVLTFAGVPSVWAHAHLGATECMQLFFWIVLAICCVNSLRQPRLRVDWWIVLWGFACAGAFLAKFTNLLAILWVLAAAALAGNLRRRRFWLVTSVGLASCPLGLLLFDPYFWPWSGGWSRFVEYLGQVGSRGEWIPIAVHYMGKNWGFSPPWHYRIVETVTTLPISTLLLFVPGVVLGSFAVMRALRGRLRQASGRDWLFLLGMAALGVTLATDVLPATPNHDITRQYVFVFVGVSLLVAATVDWILDRVATVSHPNALTTTANPTATATSTTAENTTTATTANPIATTDTSTITNAPATARGEFQRPRVERDAGDTREDREARVEQDAPGRSGLLGNVRATGSLRLVAGVFLLTLALLSFVTSLRAAPWGLSYRNVLLGGTKGAWDRGFEISYWGEAISPDLLSEVSRLESPPRTSISGDAPLEIFSVPKLTYFHDADDFWKPLVDPGLRDSDLLARDAVPAFYEKWISAERRAREGEFLRFTFRRPPAGVLFFHRRGSVADSFDGVLRHLADVGDIELVQETRIDDVSVARLYKVIRMTPVSVVGDPEKRIWYQPDFIANLARSQ